MREVAAHDALEHAPVSLGHRQRVADVRHLKSASMAKLVGHLVRLGSDEHLAVVGHPTANHTVDETVAHGGLERIARRNDLVLRWCAKEVHELLVPPTVAEVDHAREVVRERGGEGGADIRVDLLAEVREAARRSPKVA